MMRRLIDRILNRKRSYRTLFLDQDGNVAPNAMLVLADLKKFCRASSSTIVVSPVSKTIDPLAMAMAEGRREVWNRIMAHLYIDDKVITQIKDDNDGE